MDYLIREGLFEGARDIQHTDEGVTGIFVLTTVSYYPRSGIRKHLLSRIPDPEVRGRFIAALRNDRKVRHQRGLLEHAQVVGEFCLSLDGDIRVAPSGILHLREILDEGLNHIQVQLEDIPENALAPERHNLDEAKTENLNGPQRHTLYTIDADGSRWSLHYG